MCEEELNSMVEVLERIVDDTGKVCLSKEEIEDLVNGTLEECYKQSSSRVVSDVEMNGPRFGRNMIEGVAYYVRGITQMFEETGQRLSNIWDLADGFINDFDNSEGSLPDLDPDYFYEIITSIRDLAEG